MTKQEAVVATCQASVPSNSIQLALTNRGLNGTDPYMAADQTDIELASIDVLYGLLSTPDITEGGYSIKFDRSSIQARLLFLAKKNNATAIVSALAPTVTGRSPW